MANPSFATQELYGCVSVQVDSVVMGGQAKAANGTVLNDFIASTLERTLECMLLTQNERGLIYLAYLAGLENSVTYVDENGNSGSAYSVFGSYSDEAIPTDGAPYYNLKFSIVTAAP